MAYSLKCIEKGSCLTLEGQNVTFAEKLRHESRKIKQQFCFGLVLQKKYLSI